MDLRSLMYFRAIAEEGSISAAARKLHLSQPPLSYQLRLLEEELGVPLFVRGPRHAVLTDAGALLYKRSESILQLVGSAKEEVRRAGRTSMLHLGISPSAVSAAAPYLKAAADGDPSLSFDIHDGSSYALRGLLENRIIEAAVLRTPLSLRGFAVKTLKKERLCVVSTREFLKERDTVTLGELSRLPLILSERYQKECRAAFDRAGLSPTVRCTCEDTRTAERLALSGLGAALLPQSLRPQEKTNGAASADLADAALETDILIAWRQEEVSPALSVFLGTIP